MDPQKTSPDPKLKEAYDSVMGIMMPPVPQPPVTPFLPQEPVVSPIALPATGPQATSQLPSSFPQPTFQPQSQQPVPETVAYNSSAQNKQQNNQVQGKKWRLRWALVFFAIVAFLLGYAIFWTKVFGIKLPILSNFF